MLEVDTGGNNMFPHVIQTLRGFVMNVQISSLQFFFAMRYVHVVLCDHRACTVSLLSINRMHYQHELTLCVVDVDRQKKAVTRAERTHAHTHLTCDAT